MNNTNLFIVVIIVIVVVLGAFWFFGGGFPAATPEEGTTIFDAGAIEDIAAVQIASNDVLGEYATDSFGITLYTTTKEECTGECLGVWPPYAAGGTVEQDGALGTFFREDTGQYHYTWNGELLYYYSGDTVPGDTNGDGIGGVWSVARP